MAFNPGVSFFISFYDLDPSKQQRCIFFTQKGERCRNYCQQSDKKQGIELRDKIISQSATGVDIKFLVKYVLSNCCVRAKHQERIEDIRLLTPLALRWQEEVDRQAAVHSQPVPRSNLNHPRYSLRLREYSGSSLTSTGTQVSEVPLSEFRAHIANPNDSDSVSWKICESLDRRDFETGSLYIFNRSSSIEHVKIGWTAKSIESRLEEWSKCGYVPKLLFSVDGIPNAQRAETLTHYELIKEWRRERECKVCHKSHQEWFEISKERAEQVLGDWAEFMRRARPYNSDGTLQSKWYTIVKSMTEDGETVTAKKLLKLHEAFRDGQLTAVKSPIFMTHPLEIEEVVIIEDGIKKENVDDTNNSIFPDDSRQDTPQAQDEKSVPIKSQPEGSPIGIHSKAMGNPSVNDNLLQTRTAVFGANSLSGTPFVLTAKPLRKLESMAFSAQICGEGPHSKAEPPTKSEQLSENEPRDEEESSQKTTSVNSELLPEQIPLPSSPKPQNSCSTKLNVSDYREIASAVSKLVREKLGQTSALQASPTAISMHNDKEEDEEHTFISLTDQFLHKRHGNKTLDGRALYQTNQPTNESDSITQLSEIDNKDSIEDGVIWCDDEETLLEINPPQTVDEAGLKKIVDDLCNAQLWVEASNKQLSTVKVVEYAAPSPVDVVA